jgi:hypothetical protein
MALNKYRWAIRSGSERHPEWHREIVWEGSLKVNESITPRQQIKDSAEALIG